MKHFIVALVLGVACMNVNANALSCDEVNEVGESLTELGIALDDDAVEIDVGSDEEEALRQIVIGLAEIAEAENDQDLANASLAMADAWQARDRSAFTDAVADAVIKLAVVAESDCR